MCSRGRSQCQINVGLMVCHGKKIVGVSIFLWTLPPGTMRIQLTGRQFVDTCFTVPLLENAASVGRASVWLARRLASYDIGCLSYFCVACSSIGCDYSGLVPKLLCLPPALMLPEAPASEATHLLAARTGHDLNHLLLYSSSSPAIVITCAGP